jgi:hypothetical protein
MEKEKIYSTKLNCGNRTYFFDIKNASNEKPYLTITESRRIEKDKFERHNIMVFSEDIKEFSVLLEDAIKQFKEK